MLSRQPTPEKKRRTREHVIADLSANHVEKHALLCGFSVERVRHDYGIDMKNSAIAFATLEHVLERFGFIKTRVPHSHLVFEHPPSGTVRLFQLYRPQDKVTPADLIIVRKHLIERGVATDDTLDNLLH